MKKNWQIKLGVILILTSGLAFAAMLIVPFLDLDKKTKIAATTSLFVAMEILFYTGGFFVGKELFKKYKSYLNPRNWFKKRKEASTTEDHP